jgi:L-lactate dehydrogenase (cytochrome)
MTKLSDYIYNGLNRTIDGSYLAEIRKLWPRTLIAKGILRSEDARFAIDHGVDGIVVSNHGGRQLDAAPAPIDVLPMLVAEFSGKTKIIFDSGVRSGLDVARALACGADFVLLGRPFIYGIAAFGPAGGAHVYQVINDGLKIAMTQLAVETIDQFRNLDVGFSSVKPNSWPCQPTQTASASSPQRG